MLRKRGRYMNFKKINFAFFIVYRSPSTCISQTNSTRFRQTCCFW
jgi:hypothetical protein